MGYSPAHAIERAAKYVLSVLKEQREITYRRFYDGTESTEKEVEQAIVEDEYRGWYSAEHLIDLAVFQLEEQGIVVRRFLDDTLPDGEPDYAISLTRLGDAAIAGKLKLAFYDAE